MKDKDEQQRILAIQRFRNAERTGKGQILFRASDPKRLEAEHIRRELFGAAGAGVRICRRDYRCQGAEAYNFL